MKSETCPACKQLVDKEDTFCPGCGFDLAGNRYAAIARQQQQDRLVLEQVKSEQKLFGIHYETASEQAAKLPKWRMIVGILLTFAGVPLTLFCLLNIFLSVFGYHHNGTLTAIFIYLSLMFGCVSAIGIKLLTPPKQQPPIVQPNIPAQNVGKHRTAPFSQPSLSPPPAEYSWGGNNVQPQETANVSGVQPRQEEQGLSSREENGNAENK